MSEQTTQAIVTKIGSNKILDAMDPNSTASIVVTHMAIGDGLTVHSGGETELYNETFRKPLSRGGVVSGANNTVYFDLDLSAQEGPFTIREVGAFDEDGDLIAVAHYNPAIEKTLPESGQSQSGTLRINVVVADAGVILFDIDNTAFVQNDRRIDTDEESGLIGGGDFSQDRTHSIHQASEVQRGTSKIATLEQALLGISPDTMITPATLFAATGKTADGLPLFLSLSNSGQTLQDVPPLVPTLCTNMVAYDGNTSSLWNGSRFTVDANSLGVYGIFNQLNIGGENGEGAYTYKNGVPHSGYAFGETAGHSNVVGFTSFVNLLDVGDYVEFYHFHRSPANRGNPGSSVQLYRLFPYTPPPVGA